MKTTFEDSLLALTEDEYFRYYDLRKAGMSALDALLKVEEGV
jgi:hypothetical protein